MSAPVALRGFERLEASGFYADAPDAPAREALLSMGAEALTLSDFHDTPFAHWPLATIRCLRDAGDRMLLAPDDGASERLELSDPQMIAAIRAVAGELEAPQPRPKRRWGRGMVLLVPVLALAAWLGYGPLLERLAERFPPGAQQALGAQAARSYAPEGLCAPGPAGRRALELLARGFRPITRILPARGAEFSAVGPGGVMVIFDAELAAMANPETLTAAVGAAAARAAEADPMKLALRRAGPLALWRIAAQGADGADLVTEAVAAMRAQAARPAAPIPPVEPFSPTEAEWRAIKEACR